MIGLFISSDRFEMLRSFMSNILRIECYFIVWVGIVIISMMSRF